MTDSIAAQVAALPKTPTPELKQMWRDLYDKEPPGFSRNYLISRLAYRIQELAYGGLKPFCNRAARVKGSKLAHAPRMVVWQGPLFCPRSARAAAASWGQARARCINLRGCVVADRASSSGHHRGFVDVTAAPRPCRTLPPERNS